MCRCWIYLKGRRLLGKRAWGLKDNENGNGKADLVSLTIELNPAHAHGVLTMPYSYIAVRYGRLPALFTQMLIDHCI